MPRTLKDVIDTIAAGDFYDDYDQSSSDLGILRAAADLSQIPEEADFIIGKTNGGLTIHAKVGPLEDSYGDDVQEAIDAACVRFQESL
jgi:hypothetical protein